LMLHLPVSGVKNKTHEDTIYWKLQLFACTNS
jgi:hypothetical protein